MASVITVGGKGSSLSSSSVYSVATSMSLIKIDSSILEKLSQSHSKKSNSKSLSSIPPPPSNLKTLTLEESRACLVVLLNKFLLADPAVRPVLPVLIEETLNRSFLPENLDFSSGSELISSILKLNGKNSEEFGAVVEEIGVIDDSFAALIRIYALLDSNLSALVTVADAVAALSCEAAHADCCRIKLVVERCDQKVIERSHDQIVQ